MIKKKFLKSKPVCEVTFELPKDIAAQKEACVVGEFNGWDETANPMQKSKGVWKTTLKLEADQEYQFRYLVDGQNWYNDETADRYTPNYIDGDNSVLVTSNHN